MQTHLLNPPAHASSPRLFNRYWWGLQALASGGGHAVNNSNARYSARTYSVSDLKSYLSSSYYQLNSDHTSDTKTVVLTSEGPFVYWSDKFNIHKVPADGEYGWSLGFSTNHGFKLEEISGVPKLVIDQEWFIPLRMHKANYVASPFPQKAETSYLYGTTSGWPSMWKDTYFNAVTLDARHHVDAHKFHRMHEGPRKTRRYETATPTMT